jgi:hypothetical protein
VVQKYDAMPWHYYGLKHEVWCWSQKTKSMNRIDISTISIPGQNPSEETRKKGLAAAAATAIESIKVLDSECKPL